MQAESNGLKNSLRWRDWSHLNVRLGTIILHKYLLTCQFHRVLECWLKWQILSHLNVRLRRGVVHKFSAICQCTRFWNNFFEEFFQQDDNVFVPQDAAMLLLFPLLSVSLMRLARRRSVTSGHPRVVTSCFLMSGLCRTWCIWLRRLQGPNSRCSLLRESPHIYKWKVGMHEMLQIGGG